MFGCVFAAPIYHWPLQVEKRHYVKGELNGPATISWTSGDSFEFSYCNQKMEVSLHQLDCATHF